MNKDTELLGVSDIMKLLGVGRPKATYLLNQPGCPTLPRRKGMPYLVEKEAFIKWLVEKR